MDAIIKIITDEVAKKYQEFSQYSIDVKASDDDDNKFKVIANSGEQDRVGDVLVASGIDTKDYMKNPIVLGDHSYKISSIAGITTKAYVEGKKFIIEGKFADSPMGLLCKSLYNQGVLKAVSVGFLTKQRNEKNRDVIELSSLLELSFVAVPCDANALSLDKKALEMGLKSGIIIDEKKEVKTMDEVVESIKSYVDVKFADMMEEIKAVTSKDISEGDSKPIEEKKVEIPKEDAQKLVKALSEGLRIAKK